MIILEKPYTSDVMLDWLVESQHPVLNNDYAQDLATSGRNLHLVSDQDAAKLVASGERVYTCSENALDWILENADGRGLARAIRLCKDKYAMRRALADMDKSLFFQECSMDELLKIDPASLPMPVVVKPTVGFVSFAVHVVREAREWASTLEELRNEIAGGTVFPESVVGSESFIIEGFISGQEYAVDLYFDGEGAPVILDVMQHDFRDASDTSDHLYYTSRSLMGRAVPALGAWFSQANRALNFKDVCMHVELRVEHEQGADPLDAMSDSANIHVIEFNPLRFAGFCSTDLSFYAYGFRTYEWYLEGNIPSWNEQTDDDTKTAFIALEPPTSGKVIDSDALLRDLKASSADLEIRELRVLNPRIHGLSAFPIVSVPCNGDFEGFRQFALAIDPNRYA